MVAQYFAFQKPCGLLLEIKTAELKQLCATAHFAGLSMLNGTGKVVGFVPTVQPEKARSFYESALKLPLISADSFASVFDANGTTLRVTKVGEFKPHPFTILGWAVADVTATVRELQAQGVHFEKYAGMNQDEHGIWTSPSGAKVAWFKDPDGNVLGITQYP